MIVYSHSISPRLQYIIDFIGKAWLGGSVKTTCSVEEFSSFTGARINYSSRQITKDETWICPHTLLFETVLKEQIIDCFAVGGYKAFFKTGGNFPFDIFAASFYLLSRYEEYLPHTKDLYGRYAHENSLAWKEGFLNVPLVNIWLGLLETDLKKRFPAFIVHHPPFTLLPTYDIDIAWSYRHKGWWRNLGGFARSLLKGQWSLARERARVLNKRQPDPFDAYSWMNRLHEKYHLKPYYFFLVPPKRGRYDKNIHPSSKAMQGLIHDHAIRYPVGIHPSWQSGDVSSSLTKEIEILSKLAGSPILSSRQHYIRFNLPEGYRRLIDQGIRYDFSMGYGTINGFRASVASPFFWYDLQKEKSTDLLLFPFCFMEANSFYEQKQTADETLAEMRHYYVTVKKINGCFIMIWHNSFLGTDRMYGGWRDTYEKFIQEVTG